MDDSYKNLPGNPRLDGQVLRLLQRHQHKHQTAAFFERTHRFAKDGALSLGVV